MLFLKIVHLPFSPVFHDGGDGGGRAYQVLALRPEQLPPLPNRQGKPQSIFEDHRTRELGAKSFS